MKIIQESGITHVGPVIKLSGDSHDTKALKSTKRFDQLGLWGDYLARCCERLGQSRDYRLSSQGQKPTHNRMPKVFRGSTRQNTVQPSFQTSPPRGNIQ